MSVGVRWTVLSGLQSRLPKRFLCVQTRVDRGVRQQTILFGLWQVVLNKAGQWCTRSTQMRTLLLLRVPRHDAQGTQVIHAADEDVQGRIQDSTLRILRFRKYAVARRSTQTKSMHCTQSVHSLHGFANGGGGGGGSGYSPVQLW